MMVGACGFVMSPYWPSCLATIQTVYDTAKECRKAASEANAWAIEDQKKTGKDFKVPSAYLTRARFDCYPAGFGPLGPVGSR